MRSPPAIGAMGILGGGTVFWSAVRGAGAICPAMERSIRLPWPCRSSRGVIAMGGCGPLGLRSTVTCPGSAQGSPSQSGGFFIPKWLEFRHGIMTYPNAGRRWAWGCNPPPP
jgi:hypothetical protein